MIFFQVSKTACLVDFTTSAQGLNFLSAPTHTTCLVDFTTSAQGLNFLSASTLHVKSTQISVLEHLIFLGRRTTQSVHFKCSHMGLIILALDRTALVVDETCSAAQRRGSTGRALHVESTGKCDHFLVQCRRAYVKFLYENIRNL